MAALLKTSSGLLQGSEIHLNSTVKAQEEMPSTPWGLETGLLQGPHGDRLVVLGGQQI